MMPPAGPETTWKVALYTTWMYAPHAQVVSDAGVTDISTLVTRNGAGMSAVFWLSGTVALTVEVSA